MEKLVNYLRANAVRVYALLVAVVALVALYVPQLPGNEILAIAAAGIALFGGELTQRVENRKTDKARDTESYEAE